MPGAIYIGIPVGKLKGNIAITGTYIGMMQVYKAKSFYIEVLSVYIEAMVVCIRSL